MSAVLLLQHFYLLIAFVKLLFGLSAERFLPLYHPANFCQLT